MGTQMLAIGTVLNDTYRIEGLLGEGGMAVVYVVAHTRLPRRFALKLIIPEFATDPAFQERFRQEAMILGALRHPHLVDVVDWNRSDAGHPYLVMELLEGEDLAHLLARSGALPPTTALAICRQVGEALHHAHSTGIVHRDLKPANIFLCPREDDPRFVKLLDFGVAKMLGASNSYQTAAAALIGTPAYMSPEQARGQNHDIDARTDQFALAAILYEMLAGRGAFAQAGDPVLIVLDRVLRSEPAPLPQVRLDAVLRRALSKDRAARFASVQEFLAALTRAAQEPAPPPRSPASERWRRRGAALGLVLLAGGVVWRGRGAYQEPRGATPGAAQRAAADLALGETLAKAPAEAQDLALTPPPELVSVETQDLEPAAPDLARITPPRSAGGTRLVIEGAGGPGNPVYGKLRQCALAHLPPSLDRLPGGVLRLERAGTLHVVAADWQRLPSRAFQSCLERIGRGTWLPQSVTLRIMKAEP